MKHYFPGIATSIEICRKKLHLSLQGHFNAIVQGVVVANTQYKQDAMCELTQDKLLSHYVFLYLLFLISLDNQTSKKHSNLTPKISISRISPNNKSANLPSCWETFPCFGGRDQSSTQTTDNASEAHFIQRTTYKLSAVVTRSIFSAISPIQSRKL